MNKVAMTTRNFYLIPNLGGMITAKLPSLELALSFDDLYKTG